MTRRFPLRAIALLLLLAGAASASRADGLEDLRAALARLHPATPVKGRADLQAWHRVGDGGDAAETRAQAGAGLEDGPPGLQVTYARALLAKLDDERRARAADPEAKTPTVDAMSELQLDDLQRLANAAQVLQRLVERSRFVGEKPQAWNGRPARLLSFASSVDSLSARERKYVKSFEGGVDVWVAADGTPLASRQHSLLHGRAYVVVSFDVTQDEQCVYAVANDRLVMARRETHLVSSGLGDRDERRVTTTVAWGS